MCGIAGIVHMDPNHEVREETLQRFIQALDHRGPDDRGTFLEGPAGLCHTRLSILDLSSRGHQPMQSADGRYVLCYNGEVYNFRELRSELEQVGCAFQSGSDTEVVLQLLAREGAAGIARLEGMFAFAFYDRHEKRLLLARDRLGIKPLFWSRDDDALAFASEPKALPASLRRGTPEAARVAEYLAFRHLAGEESLQPGVETLAPGHLLELRGRDLSVRRWWEPELLPRADPDAVMEVIAGAVEKQLVSDVPVGIFLSGGVDSSLVTSAAARAHESIASFTVGFDEAGWDESDRAKIVADACGTRQHIIRLRSDAYASELAEAIWHLDSPLNHAHSVHLLELSRVARRTVTVVLTGEGGDELYGGYPRYRIFLASRVASAAPSGGLRWLSGLLRHQRPRLSRLLDAAAGDTAYAAAINAAFLPLDDAALLAGCDPEEAIAPRAAIASEALAKTGDGVDALLALERRTYLVSLLQRMDRMSMAAGLECRVPLLDERMIEHSTSLSGSDKLSLTDSKMPLRRASERRYGREYARAPKFGFGVPLDGWFRGEGPIGRLMKRILEERRTRDRGWVDVGLAQRMLSEHRSGERDRTEALWGLLNLEIWARVGLDGDPPKEALGDLLAPQRSEA